MTRAGRSAILYAMDEQAESSSSLERARDNNIGERKDRLPVEKNRGNAGKGRPRGAKNKLSGAHGDLLTAWDCVAGPETAKTIMKAAVEKAKSGDFEALRTILPYIARRMPDTLELGPIESMTPDEIERRWRTRQDI